MNEETPHAHAESTCIFCEATDALKKFLHNIGPSEEAANHFRQSRVELLKGIRRVIDDRIERVSRTTEHKGTHVVVE
jgi:hypothetical protein